jgi:hypothetical protein
MSIALRLLGTKIILERIAAVEVFAYVSADVLLKNKPTTWVFWNEGT